MSDEMREALEAAFESEENEEENAPIIEDDSTAPDTTVESDPDVEPDTGTVSEDEPVVDEPPATTKAPQSWTPSAREHWDKIPAEAQAQIAKRDQEVMNVMNEASQYKNFSQGFNQMVAPFQGMFAAQNVDPMQGIQNVLKTAATLQGGNMVQKAQAAAQLIQDFGVDVTALDDLLVGNMPTNNPNDQMMQMQKQLDQQNQFMQNQQNQQNQFMQRKQQTINNETTQFINDNEFAGELRGVMADFMDMAERQGQRLDLKQAYQRAIGTRPDIQQVISNRLNTKGNVQALSNARTAGASIPQNGTVNPSASESQSLRASIQSAFDA